MIRVMPPRIKIGTERYVKKYAWYPVKFFNNDDNKEYRIWLEYYYVRQYYGFVGGSWVSWKNQVYYLTNPEKEKQFKKEMEELINGQ